VRRIVVAGLIALCLVAGVARAAIFRGTEGNDRLVGSSAADTIYGLAGDDVVAARGGNDLVNPGFGRDRVTGEAGDDRIAAQDGSVDTISCGAGKDVVTADLTDAVAADCETVSRQIARDRTDLWFAQHATQVEPDSFAWRRTIVAAFQNGRVDRGGAAALGWATSVDAGAHWKSGVLPQGQYTVVSDPVVAFDAMHGVWLAAGLGSGPGALDIYIVRSRDGVTWSGPVRAAGDVDEDYDKEWLNCDNGLRSPFRGRCYLAYVDVKTHWLAVRHSVDGGATWTAPVRLQPGVAKSTFSGPMPTVQPNGNLVIPYVLFAPINGEDRIAAVTSTDGAETFDAPVRIAQLIAEEPMDIRAPAMPAADVDSAGRLYVAWQDSRFRREDGVGNDIVFSSSPDGVVWSDPWRIRLPQTAQYFLPALAVDPATSGKNAKLAVAFYSMKLRAGCVLFVPGCAEEINAWLVESKDAGTTWTPARRLNAEPMQLEWLAETTLGRMLGDYISVSFAGGKAVPVLALSGEPSVGGYTEAVFAARAK
jgi:Ca2+-binding RTX toxin-like protein